MMTRLDKYLLENGYFPSRARAQAAIAEGLVRVNGQVVLKPAQSVSHKAKIELLGDVHSFVSRGGVKLEAALRKFAIDPGGKICLDLGASTGGFTDVLLRQDAAKIYAVDVGQGQLHEKIAADPRVINLEKIHAKDLSSAVIADPVELIVCDVSFISLKKALPPVLALTGDVATVIALIKPQFEVGKSGLGKGGIVREGLGEPAAREAAKRIEAQGWSGIGFMPSPIAGGDGNQEYLFGATKNP